LKKNTPFDFEDPFLKLTGSWSLDRISLDLFTRSKVSLKFGSILNAISGSRLNCHLLALDRKFNNHSI
jgi:hypothetical protein